MQQNLRDNVEALLSDDCACYVLITCDKPSKNGEMQVAMSYQGDKDLASYLLHGALETFEERL